MSRIRIITLSLMGVIIILGVFSLRKLNLEMQGKSTAATQTGMAMLIPSRPTNAISTNFGRTSTPSPLPTATSCDATVVGGERLMFELPTRGVMQRATSLADGTKVTIKNHLADYGWIPAYYSNQLGWFKSDFLRYDSLCVSKLPVESLTTLFQNSPEGFKPIFEDAFYDDRGNWYDLQNHRYTSRGSNEFGDYFLSLSAGLTDQTVARLVGANFGKVGDFELQMSISPIVDLKPGYGGFFGIRFRTDENTANFYELRIFEGCKIKLYRVEQNTQSTVISDSQIRLFPQSSSCDNGLEEYVRLSVINNELTGQINDQKLPAILLSDPQGILSVGGFEFLASGTKSEIFFMTLTGP